MGQPLYHFVSPGCLLDKRADSPQLSGMFEGLGHPFFKTSKPNSWTSGTLERLCCHTSNPHLSGTAKNIQVSVQVFVVSISLLISLHATMVDSGSVQRVSDAHWNFTQPAHHQNTSEATIDLSLTSVQLAPQKFSGGFIYKLRDEENRLHTPWFRPNVVYLPRPWRSNHRYLYSPVRRGAGDGLGHAMATINLEVTLALMLSLTYTHRVSDYSSLTRENTSAVEAFFGWGDGEIPRRDIQSHGCNPRHKSGKWPTSSETLACQECGSPMTNGSLGIKYVVDLPREIAQKCLSLPDCEERIKRFFKMHPHSHTIFQLPSSMCGPAMVNSDFTLSKNFFYHKYWRRHGHLLWYSKSSKLGTDRRIRMDPDHLHIAIHVRRGDFLLPRAGRLHHVTHDEVFANILQQVLWGIYDGGGSFSRLPIIIHIYSEGMLNPFQGKSLHDTNAQDKNYYDGHGVRRDVSWWESLLYNRGESSLRKAAKAYRSRLRFHMHISEDTLVSAHEMVSADIFVGSFSGLSTHLVWSLARGITVLPTFGTIENPSKEGTPTTCCTVRYTQSGKISLPLFSRFWIAYSRANEATVRRYETAPFLISLASSL